MTLQLSGLLGIYIMLLTIGVMGVFALITFIITVYQSHYGTSLNRRKMGLQSFFVSFVVLILDLLIFYCSALSYESISFKQGNTLDWWGLFVWLPIHIIGGLVIAFFIWYLNRINKAKFIMD